MISLYRWDASQKQGAWQEHAQLPHAKISELSPSETWWIDLDDPSEEEERLVFKEFLPIHSLSLEDITKPRLQPEQGLHFPKVEQFPDYLFLIANPIRANVVERKTGKLGELRNPKSTNVQLSSILTSNVLITHHYEHLPNITVVKQLLGRHPEMAERGPDYLCHLILDAMVDEYAPVLDRVVEGLDIVEIRLFRKPTRMVLSRLLRWKRIIIALRKTLILEREILARLTRGEFALVEPREIAYYRNVYDHLVRYTELIEGAREMVSDLMQTHLAVMSNRLNGIMKVLAMISTVVLPMTLIAGIYGMNFHKGMPELDWDYGYLFALILMGVSATVSVGVFYWKKWF